MEPATDQISNRAKWGLYLFAWGAVLFVSVVGSPSSLLATPYFPVGLLAMLPDGVNKAIDAWMRGPVLILIGWSIYGALTFIIGRTKKTGAFLLVYILFCVLLALNLVGCAKTLDELSKIH